MNSKKMLSAVVAGMVMASLAGSMASANNHDKAHGKKKAHKGKNGCSGKNGCHGKKDADHDKEHGDEHKE